MKNDRRIPTPPTTSTDAEKFDPFENRTARDLRNSLSVALAQALENREPDVYRQLARRWCRRDLTAGCRHYLENRLDRYDQFMARWQAAADHSAMMCALHLWNASLFFEVHEVIERKWHTASGGRREALKALIQAAGVFVHLEAGRSQPAQRLAAKAAGGLRRWGRHLTEIGNVDELLSALATRPPCPCRLAAAVGDAPVPVPPPMEK